MSYFVGPLLLALSGFGFWRWIVLSLSNNVNAGNIILPVVITSLVPLGVFFILAVKVAQRLENERISPSYQSRLDNMQKRLNDQEDLLSVITDKDPEAIAIFDDQKRFWFLNASGAQSIGHNPSEVIGKPLHKFLSQERTRLIETRLKDVLTTGNTLEALDKRTDANNQIRYTQTRFEKIEPFGAFPGGVIVRTENVTGLLLERQRRESMLRQVINTLVAVVDRRDPYASGHSARVGQLSRALAEELVLNETDIETAEIAGSLMNFGKVLVPRQILTKTTALSAEELQRVRDSILTSADILAIIDFPTPIVPTLHQVLERVDGSGAPQGLKGDEILMTARIVTVANAFVALVSARAHRDGLELNEAVDRMKAEVNTAYDRRVVSALSNFVLNRARKLDWLKAQTKKVDT
jgi:PAS domain S-box-containing protein